MSEPVLNLSHSRGETRIVSISALEMADAMAECLVITDTNLALHQQSLLSQPKHVITIPAGESSKTWETTGHVLEQLALAGADRRSRVLAFGGGVVGDLAGFAAAAYMRGVPLVQAPTSLLAMVDSSVGGKVGVDLEAGKNLAGSFWPAYEVWLCYPTLETLPENEWRNGAAEIWKYGAIRDAKLFDELLASPIHPGYPGIAEVVERCIRLKADVVQADEFETTGLRAILNFGHTLGHAVEAELNYQGISHGEAVAIGMVWESRLAERLGIASAGLAEQISEAMQLQGLPVHIPAQIEPLELLKWMKRDKKAAADKLAFSLVSQIGKCKLYEGVSEAEVRALLTEK